ncbi:hypothetical protein [Psychrobacillus sp. OK032]|uniref:hypothetical protein n=1 Tax=Psychrobacillus sp. OK032 TaxID=1884358 RepID=UPI0008CB3762|nr:hypothetical protein [Psychrobacillus sp. OK032]SER89454.1 hypothetical protein SAMN05518872_102536 [Psychrobacillus sp. OK032]
MNQIKKLFFHKSRELISVFVFFLLILIWTSITSKDYHVSHKIFIAFFATGIFVFVRWSLKEKQ